MVSDRQQEEKEEKTAVVEYTRWQLERLGYKT